MREQRARMSRHAEVGKAMGYMLTRWDAFSRFLTDGRICLTNNAAERELRGVALGRKAWMFAGSDRGGERAAAMYSLIATAKLNGVDPRAWLADVLARIADHPASRLNELLPWHWKASKASRNSSPTKSGDRPHASAAQHPRPWPDGYGIRGAAIPGRRRAQACIPLRVGALLPNHDGDQHPS